VSSLVSASVAVLLGRRHKEQGAAQAEEGHSGNRGGVMRQQDEKENRTEREEQDRYEQEN
jgi:hypothetical protein